MTGMRTITGIAAEGLASSYGANSTAVAAAGKQATAAQTEDAFFQIQQAAVGKQITEFAESVQVLNRRLRVFSSGGMFELYYSKSGSGEGFSSFARNSLRSLVDAYNNVNGMIKSSGYVTEEGKRLLNGVQGLLQGKEGQDYLNMGLMVDKDTGMIKLDEQKLVSFLGENAEQAKKLLVDKGFLAPMLQNIVEDVLGKKEDYYFCRPFSVSV
ncbi:hypothetical protein KL86SPO_70555 [uncultured Sporomusa sp.]|uniref:Flagellar hook-associated protein 2 C-terminal domain-containing protein n=1 Tax=uncultured Sporomusa sp. TaxID=307249 RepID=A0A212M1R9_9FIRM|nr:hypothetical protein [uncultured Sporomusa sp.]SCM83697.1 hypothetical protein KL86SPO_70555 [uncultured Sporomusa sp.]